MRSSWSARTASRLAHSVPGSQIKSATSRMRHGCQFRVSKRTDASRRREAPELLRMRQRRIIRQALDNAGEWPRTLGRVVEADAGGPCDGDCDSGRLPGLVVERERRSPDTADRRGDHQVVAELGRRVIADLELAHDQVDLGDARRGARELGVELDAADLAQLEEPDVAQVAESVHVAKLDAVGTDSHHGSDGNSKPRRMSSSAPVGGASTGTPSARSARKPILASTSSMLASG